jgi:hypothetical protein
MKTKNKKDTKRNYTKRGTTVVGVRTVLMNGVPVGRGKPSKDHKGDRHVVYVPRGETYDAAKHGTGVRFNKAFHGVTKRLAVVNTVMKYTHETPETKAPETPVAAALEAPTPTIAHEAHVLADHAHNLANEALALADAVGGVA